jgi:PIN domain nuclease of toxin-antitoxin system
VIVLDTHIWLWWVNQDSGAIASRAVDLPEHHRDPQDRIIIATALVHGALLLSSDAKFTLYEELGGQLLG